MGGGGELVFRTGGEGLDSRAEIPAIPSKYEVVADYSFSKMIVGVVHMMKLRRECESAMVSITMVNLKLQACLHLEHKLLRGQYPPEIPGLMENKKKLQLVREHLPVYMGGIQQFQSELEHLLIEQAKLDKGLADDKRCHQKMKMLLEKIVAVHQLFRKNRQAEKVSYNDEQIHKFEKIHLSRYIKRMKSLFRDVSQRYKNLLITTNTWGSILVGIQSRLEDFRSFSRGLLADLEMMQQMKEEMATLVRELECNNSIIEGLEAVDPAIAALKPSLSRPSTL
ncbi:hypothetical protein CRUP_014125 [Coryphaenoides rupestris]|nr:hypothetical protein CRUP_014125 [Coryphaenoides rupestris]